MARQRMLHPGFFTDADLAECSPLARILFEGLWVEADREGRLVDDPRELKVKLLPYDACSVAGLIDELERIDAVRRYEVGDQKLLWLPKFLKYQHPHQREAPSVLPEPPAEPRKGGAQPVPSPEKAMPSRAESVSESVSESESVTEQLRAKKPPAGPRRSALRDSDFLEADFEDLSETPYAWNGAKDGVALTALLAHSPLEEVRRRWRRGLMGTGWYRVSTVAQLKAKWNDLAAPLKATGPPAGSAGRAPATNLEGSGPLKAVEGAV